MIQLINNDCRNVMDDYDMGNIIVVTDPPFNIGYKYENYHDKMPENEYNKMLADIVRKSKASVIIHYPEQLHRLSIEVGYAPNKVVSWVYNSNTKKQHRDIAFYNIKPIMSQVKQPYKNPNDKRIKERIANGCQGADLYDWWNINQVKNVSKDKTKHPCQMPIEVMKNIIGILPKDAIILDPFMGSGTTGIACKELERSFIGIEIDEEYFDIAKQRIQG